MEYSKKASNCKLLLLDGYYISLTLNFIKDKLLSEQDVMKRAEEIQSEMSQANEIGSQFPTNQGDYDKAKSGIQNGEENYTEEELDLWE